MEHIAAEVLVWTANIFSHHYWANYIQESQPKPYTRLGMEPYLASTTVS